MMAFELLLGGWLAINLISVFLVIDLLSDMREVGMIKGTGKYKDVVTSRVTRIVIPLPYVAILCSNIYHKTKFSNKKGG